MASFLTRVEVNPRRRASGRILSSPHRMHGAVSACFPPSRTPTRPLWRVDRTRTGIFLYIVSDIAPDPTGFVEEHGWPLAGGWQTRSYEEVLDRVTVGSQFGFRLTANPVRHRRAGDSNADERTRGKRVAHVTAAQQLDWFVGRGDQWGFSVGSPEAPTARIVERRTIEFKRQEASVTIGVATFEGILRVTDATQLRSSLTTGLGPAKAYGCGLLTLAPPP